mmetsp:Transcript_35527/g.52055  ORF Transcript_35527/g.52055 Transcript_35527/m.52055 type:complete len:105 (-) Transcript_35527:251-565(-)
MGIVAIAAGVTGGERRRIHHETQPKTSTRPHRNRQNHPISFSIPTKRYQITAQAQNGRSTVRQRANQHEQLFRGSIDSQGAKDWEETRTDKSGVDTADDRFHEA